MLHTSLLSKAAATLATGMVGAAAYDAVRKLAATAPAHAAAVTVTEWGLRGMRKAEVGAESARLKAADIVAEARDRLGEQVQPPATSADGHDHEH
ncbi:DUF1490 family protein [Rhodococcus sp. D2-41]|uniref:DUF1490 family protein n=1 Tax=Speluncibacter jeojiensis TaxID=2710754 RepID=A0A9X4M5M6_9ACTN|nr:DUF1490 family protein [Rhodococcus sp. D2-41]MDG3010210.1 DUF1490 family protein [Rhodococcus sp. D2-41]MDG3015723.1 DUF1490 family protein [Corynebacteriales bacterium D3-21]